MKTTKWYSFMDMHSGGGLKNPPYEYIYVEACSEKQAIKIFSERFDDPFHVTCSCCGEDYAIAEHSSLQQATAFERGCDFVDDTYVERPRKRGDFTYQYVSLDIYLKREDILIVPLKQ